MYLFLFDFSDLYIIYTYSSTTSVPTEVTTWLPPLWNEGGDYHFDFLLKPTLLLLTELSL